MEGPRGDGGRAGKQVEAGWKMESSCPHRNLDLKSSLGSFSHISISNIWSRRVEKEQTSGNGLLPS